MPPWFPFALVATGIIALASGQRAGILPGKVEGAITKHWYYWLISKPGSSRWYGPELLTGAQAYDLEIKTRLQNPGVRLLRIVWDGRQWQLDARTSGQLALGESFGPVYA
jgi:hypothetical protein